MGSRSCSYYTYNVNLAHIIVDVFVHARLNIEEYLSPSPFSNPLLIYAIAGQSSSVGRVGNRVKKKKYYSHTRRANVGNNYHDKFFGIEKRIMCKLIWVYN